MSKYALIIIDVQNFLVSLKPFDFEQVVSNIKKLIQEARANQVEVIYIQHTIAESQMALNTVGWQVYDEIKPLAKEKTFSKYFNSAFKNTELRAYLDSKDINALVLTGMQTEFCVDKTATVAFEFGYNVIMPEKTNTTYDTKLISAQDIYTFYNHGVFLDLATVEDVDATINRFKR